MASGSFTAPSYLRGIGPADIPAEEPAAFVGRRGTFSGTDADVRAGQTAGLLALGAVIVLVMFNAIGFRATVTGTARAGRS